MPTSRLGLPTPVGTDLISAGDDAISALTAILDRSALWLVPGTFAARPAASGNDGKFYLADDISILYVSDGTNWHEVSRGGGAVPIGGMLDYAGDADPSDTRYLLCDGRAISRSTYAAAFAVMGTAFGAGDGTTTFNIPDTRGRSVVSPDNMGTGAGSANRLTANNTRGASGGTETKTIAEANLPAHAHGVGSLVTGSTGAHDHAFGTLATVSGGAHTHGVGTLAMGTESADHTHGFSGSTGLVSNDHAHSITLRTAAFQFAGGNYLWDQMVVRSDSGSASGSFGVGSGGISANHTHAFSGGTGGRSAAHTHSMSGATASDGAHTHAMSGSVASNGAHTHPITGSTGSIGSGTAYNAMTPYLVANKIVRVS